MLRFFKKKNLLQGLEEQRAQCLQYNLATVLKDNLMQPLPDKNTLFQVLPFLVVDFETTGFDVETNDIISIGWVEISNMQIDVASQKHLYINNGKQINHETAVINHIVPQMVSHGVTLEEAINTLLHHSKNKILVVHGKTIEKRFIDFYAQNSLGLPELPLIWIDTLIIEKWHLLKIGAQFSQDNRLSSVRKRYNLPQYTAHNALIDSIAAAELLLAQMAHIYRDRKVTFERLYEISQ
ncbi:3'-5' exonuclease [Psychromonas antarctica]|jgi:DNA polymerase-3 subunit epsilon|uniref:3'-5' exonuclease n=1 Tax=Psychromonas antarctica TaxID=67573 RepID=UPI001EE8D158|nr:3'-5' exonuclease [Psychromonas antarctica]MCG6200696.1 3'-5' exonuclease [Psychromonas antarctica]